VGPAPGRASSSQVGLGPIPEESSQVGIAPMTAAWRPAASARRAAVVPARWAVLRQLVVLRRVAVLLRSAGRRRRLLSTGNPRAAVVSPINPQCATRPLSPSQAKAEPMPVAVQRQVWLIGNHDRADCRSASPEPCPKTLSDNLLHDYCCDCLQGTGQEICASHSRAPFCTGYSVCTGSCDLGPMVPRNRAYGTDY
jgi:hypothetical protein